MGPKSGVVNKRNDVGHHRTHSHLKNIVKNLLPPPLFLGTSGPQPVLETSISITIDLKNYINTQLTVKANRMGTYTRNDGHTSEKRKRTLESSTRYYRTGVHAAPDTVVKIGKKPRRGCNGSPTTNVTKYNIQIYQQ